MKNKLYYKGELLIEISYQNGKVWVSDEIVKKNNCYIQFYDERFDGVIRWAENDSNIKAEHYKKIICQSTGLNIDGVPYVSFESNEVYKLAEKEYPTPIPYEFEADIVSTRRMEGFIKGYQAHSETHSLSDDEVVQFARWMFLEDTSFTAEKYANFTDKDMLQYWKEQRSKEWEVVCEKNYFCKSCDIDQDSPFGKCDETHKHCSCEERLLHQTYIKDGKEFLTIKLK